MGVIYFIFRAFFAAGIAHAAFFGADTRQATHSGSTAIAVLSSLHDDANGKISLEVDSLSDMVCSDERFAKDPSLSYSCTGFLVAPDLIVTAGHCMVNTGEERNETQTYCSVYSWLFDYQTDENGHVQTKDIPANKLYKCKQVVYAVREEGAPYRDFAIVQLDRPVLDRKPFKIAEGALATQDTFSMVGYPFGSPAKLSYGGKILHNDSTRQSFITNLAAFEGNSGSPVFNSKNEVVGILIGGTPSENLYQDPVNKCQRYNHCDLNGEHCALPDTDTSVFPGYQRTGSEVQRIAPVLEMIRAMNVGV